MTFLQYISNSLANISTSSGDWAVGRDPASLSGGESREELRHTLSGLSLSPTSGGPLSGGKVMSDSIHAKPVRRNMNSADRSSKDLLRCFALLHDEDRMEMLQKKVATAGSTTQKQGGSGSAGKGGANTVQAGAVPTYSSLSNNRYVRVHYIYTYIYTIYTRILDRSFSCKPAFPPLLSTIQRACML